MWKIRRVLNFDKHFICMMLLGLICLFAVQIQKFENYRAAFQREKILSTLNEAKTARLKISIDTPIDLSKLDVLINGEKYSYTLYENSIEVVVRNKDVVELDARKIKNPFFIQVTAIDDAIKDCIPKERMQPQQDILYIGKINL